jgi:hypothetical protein
VSIIHRSPTRRPVEDPDPFRAAFALTPLGQKPPRDPVAAAERVATGAERDPETGTWGANTEARVMGQIGAGRVPAEVAEEERAADLLAPPLTPQVTPQVTPPPSEHLPDSPPPNPGGSHQGSQRGLSILLKLLWGLDVEPAGDDESFLWSVNRALAGHLQAGGGKGPRGPVTPPDLFLMDKAGHPGTVAERAGPALYW